jgi:hypothetical protein
VLDYRVDIRAVIEPDYAECWSGPPIRFPCDQDRNASHHIIPVVLSKVRSKRKSTTSMSVPTPSLTAVSRVAPSRFSDNPHISHSLRPPQAVTSDPESRHHICLAADTAAVFLLAHLKLLVLRALATEPVLAAGLVELIALVVRAAQLGQAFKAHLGDL